jgi:hypothetical protein
MRKAISISTLALMLLQMGAGSVPAAAQPVAGLLESFYPVIPDQYRTLPPDPSDQMILGAAERRRDSLREYLEDTGYAVRLLTFEDLCDPAQLDPESLDLLVLPDASALPVDAAGPIEAFLRGGGDILAMNTPMWQRQLIWDDEEWLDRDAYRKKAGPGLLHHTIVDFSPETVAAWHRSTNDPANFALYESVGPEGGPGSHALHAQVRPLNNWDTLVSPPIDAAFPEGHEMIVFYARGGPQTTELLIEWCEKDGARWLATVPLTDQWQPYVLEPKDFHLWESAPHRAGTLFNPQNVDHVSVGLAQSHTRLSGDAHEYWVGPIGSAPRTLEHERMLTSFKSPVLETLSPGYKFFTSHDVFIQSSLFDIPFSIDSAPLRMQSTVFSSHPRPGGGGFDKGRDWRWQSLLIATDANNQWRGIPGTMLIHSGGPYKGGVWSSFSISDPVMYRTQDTSSRIRRTLQQMRRGVFLIDGGADHYTYFEGQPMRLGLRVANLGRENQSRISGRVTLWDSEENTVFQKEWTFDIAPGAELQFEEAFTPEDWPEAGFVVLAELLENGKQIDSARHEVYCWKPKDNPNYMTVKNGEFMLDGQRWRAHGINYMPSSGIGTEDWSYFEHWVGKRSYHPEIIERDLRHIVDMGFNSVSIFIHHVSLSSQNLLDLLRRIDAHGLKANLSLRPGTPMDFEWKKMRDLIECYRIAEHDCVFALDLAWEPMFGMREARRPYDATWREWIEERYGSIENAERDWDYPAPRGEDGTVTNPEDHQLASDGDWRRMVAAYRRFLDTLLYENYSRARRMVRTLDPHHLISFRMAEAGNPTFLWDKAVPYDFAYLAGAVDILEPEAYGRIGDWEKVKPGWFTYEYARWANPDLPMIWSEAGVHVWSESMMEVSEDLLKFQAEYYRDLYRMFISSGADGIFFWWYPGGYRVNERSDYGIINPDGSDRPVTRVIREMGPQLLAGPSAKPVDTWLEFDRDLHPDALAGIYDAAKDAFWQAIEAGKTPGLRTAGTGTTSADSPLIAVGNTPCNGTNPPKYLDGFFDVVEVRDADGEWVEAQRGATIPVAAGKPVHARITLSNLGEAKWLAPASGANTGTVYIKAEGAGAPDHPLPKDLPRFGELVLEEVVLAPGGIDASISITLGFEARGRTPFGPRHTLHLNPVP